MSETEPRAVVALRLTAQERAAFHIAADLAGMPMTTWMRHKLRAEAARVLRAKKLPVPFLEEVAA